MRTLYIGDEKNQDEFPVYQDLLILHSECLYQRIREATGEGTIVIEKIKPALFTEFVFWINSGNFLPVESTTPALDVAIHWVQLWQMGSGLQVRASLL
jgi:hypothetical protein